jgi:hypothetical protein
MTHNEAYRHVRNAIKSGLLMRPDICSKCGDKPALASDGRSRIHAHHHDYNRPLDVEWLCAKCHRKETPLPSVMGAPTFGERNGQAKLNAEIVRMIRESKESAVKLGKRLGVHHATVSRARRGDHWLAAAKEAA